MGKRTRQEPEVRINVILPLSEREAFDRWCRYGGRPKQSMTWRIRKLIEADAAGKVDLPRTEPQKHRK